MSRQQSLQRGSALMVLGAVIFLAYAVVFFFLAFSSSGFEIGVATLNGVAAQQSRDHGLHHAPSPSHGNRGGAPGLVR